MYSYRISSRSIGERTGEIVKKEPITVTEKQAFNAQFEQYEGKQSGVNVKTLFSYVISIIFGSIVIPSNITTLFVPS